MRRVPIRISNAAAVRRHATLTCALAALTMLWACATGPLSRLSTPASPRDAYDDTLVQAGLAETALGRDWRVAGERALQRPVVVTTPFRETGYFPPATPSATAYRVELQRGRRLSVEVAMETAAPTRVFVDLFLVHQDASPERVTSLAQDATTLVYEVPQDGAYLVRIQPELLRGGRYTLSERTLASLGFPVQGLTASAIQSEFGARRDAGRREHEGVDIFAPRGTPVVAVADGLARTDTNGLGGNVVWVRDAQRTYYYAHLDGWTAEGTRRVAAGDVLGYVGNTGNARTTAPHLHFGIYDGDAVDPLPFLAPDEAQPAHTRQTPSLLGAMGRTLAVRVPMREGAHRTAALIRDLPRGSVGRVLGEAAGAYRLHLPDDTSGYVDAPSLTAGAVAWRRDRLPAGSALMERPAPTAPVIEVLEAPQQADVLGRFEGFSLVRLGAAREGWIVADVPAGRALTR